MRLPAGIQDFTKLREKNYLYVDKTMYILPLLEGGQFFLARPRRFGKSLLMSTVKAAFAGRKDLFKGLWLEENYHFKPHPIVRLDFSLINYTSLSLDAGIVEWLKVVALEYGYTLQSNTARTAFRELILELAKTAKVVVLVDEYDKPITDYLLEPEKRNEHQAVLKSVYGVLKPLDAYLHLVFLTGVSKIGKLSLFSDLNNLTDISLNEKYALSCGYTKQDIETHFPSYLEPIAKRYHLSLERFMEAVAFWYNGYSWDGVNRVYCPYSFLLFLEQQQFKTFWYETGTPTFLVELVRNAHINPLEFDHSSLDAASISVTNVEDLDPISLMFQTGYLTIGQVNESLEGTFYTLSYPNNEVRQAFSSSLLVGYSKLFPSRLSGFSIGLREALQKLDWDTVFAVCNQVLSSVPYEIFPRQEIYVHSLLHLIFTSTGLRTQSQIQTSLGRMDTLVTTQQHSIIFEYKIGGTPQAALEQIEEKRYAESLQGKVYKVGVVFDLEQKRVSMWAVG